jgi:hypothetical protein
VKRRAFITLLGSAAVAWPLAARAQQAVPVVGVLSAEWPNLFSDRLRAFHDGRRETGYVEGRNLAIEYRWAEGRNDRFFWMEFLRRRREFIAMLGAAAAWPLTARARIFRSAPRAKPARTSAPAARRPWA